MFIKICDVLNSKIPYSSQMNWTSKFSWKLALIIFYVKMYDSLEWLLWYSISIKYLKKIKLIKYYKNLKITRVKLFYMLFLKTFKFQNGKENYWFYNDVLFS